MRLACGRPPRFPFLAPLLARGSVETTRLLHVSPVLLARPRLLVRSYASMYENRGDVQKSALYALISLYLSTED